MRRVDDDNRQPGRDQRCGDHGLEAPGRLNRNQCWGVLSQASAEFLQPFAVAGCHESLPARGEMDVQLILRDIDASVSHFHKDPSLSNRARALAALARSSGSSMDQRMGIHAE